MKDIDWSKAPEGATHAYQHGDENITWYKDIKENTYSFCHNSAETWSTIHDNGNQTAPVWYPLIPRPTQWKGPQDGLPPVGATHEDADLFGLGYSKPKYEVVAHHYNGVTAIVSVQTEDGIQYRPAKAPHFRPIQSELDKLLNYAHNLVDKKLISSNASADGSFSLEKVIKVLFDAGMLVDPERKSMSREKAIYNIQPLVPDLDTAQAMAIADMLGHED